jgi:hypothetical protein
MKDTKQSLLEEEEERLNELANEAGELAAVRETVGYQRLLPVISHFYAKCAELNMEEGGVRTERWNGVREGLQIFFKLVGDSESKLQQLSAAMVDIEGRKNEDVEPGSDFMTQVGGSVL